MSKKICDVLFFYGVVVVFPNLGCTTFYLGAFHCASENNLYFCTSFDQMM